jgi:hypothetical protein
MHMGKTKTDAERRKHLEKLGLKASGDTLGQPPKHKPDSDGTPVLAPPGIDPRAMPVDDITFDPRLLDRFPSLEGDGRRAACDYVFALYKSYAKGDRNKVLWKKVNDFVTSTRLNRKTGGVVKEKVKTSAEERDLAQLIAAAGITAEDLAKIIREKT